MLNAASQLPSHQTIEIIINQRHNQQTSEYRNRNQQMDRKGPKINIFLQNFTLQLNCLLTKIMGFTPSPSSLDLVCVLGGLGVLGALSLLACL